MLHSIQRRDQFGKEACSVTPPNQQHTFILPAAQRVIPIHSARGGREKYGPYLFYRSSIACSASPVATLPSSLPPRASPPRTPPPRRRGLRWVLSPPVGADPRVCPPCVPFASGVRADTGVCPYRWVCHSSLEGYRVPLGGRKGGYKSKNACYMWL